MAIAGASGQSAGAVALVAGAVATWYAGARAGPGAALGRVVAVGPGLALHRALGAVALALGPAAAVTVAKVAAGAPVARVGVGVAVLLLGRPHARVVADDVVPGRLYDWQVGRPHGIYREREIDR